MPRFGGESWRLEANRASGGIAVAQRVAPAPEGWLRSPLPWLSQRSLALADGFDLGQFGGEAVRMTEVVMPGISGFRQKRRGVALAEKPGRIVEDAKFAPAVAPELIARKVTCQGSLKLLFDKGVFICGF